MGTVTVRCCSLRPKNACGVSCTVTSRSPAGPPRSPSPPRPASRTFCPAATPAGMRTFSVLVLVLRPVAPAGAARRRDDASAAAAGAAGLAEREPALAARGDTLPAARRARLRRRPRRRPGTGAGGARAGSGQPQRHRGAPQRVEEVQGHGGLEVGAAAGALCAGVAAPAEQPAQHVAEAASAPTARPPEQVAEVEARHAGAAPAPTTGEAGTGAEQAAGLVVLATLLVVGEHVVGLRHGLEPLLAPGVLVRVQIAGQRPVGLLDLRCAGVLADAERGVVVLLDVPGAHGATSLSDSAVGTSADRTSASGAAAPPSATETRAGRSTRPPAAPSR